MRRLRAKLMLLAGLDTNCIPTRRKILILVDHLSNLLRCPLLMLRARSSHYAVNATHAAKAMISRDTPNQMANFHSHIMFHARHISVGRRGGPWDPTRDHTWYNSVAIVRPDNVPDPKSNGNQPTGPAGVNCSNHNRHLRPTASAGVHNCMHAKLKILSHRKF